MKAVALEYWWDRLTRQWIIQAKDPKDNQVGAAGYAPNKRALPGVITGMATEHKVPSHKWTRT